VGKRCDSAANATTNQRARVRRFERSQCKPTGAQTTPQEAEPPQDLAKTDLISLEACLRCRSWRQFERKGDWPEAKALTGFQYRMKACRLHPKPVARSVWQKINLGVEIRPCRRENCLRRKGGGSRLFNTSHATLFLPRPYRVAALIRPEMNTEIALYSKV
jgi:hypothetical protein